jgi:hypothetical protein
MTLGLREETFEVQGKTVWPGALAWPLLSPTELLLCFTSLQRPGSLFDY